MKKVVCIMMIMFYVCIPAISQERVVQSNLLPYAELSRKPEGFLRNLLDPSKFYMTQSYSFSVLSSGRQTYNMGLYLNTMTYRFSDPLLMQLRVGYMHQPLGGSSYMSSAQQGSLFIQGFNVLYKPMDNMIISLDYESNPYMFANPYWGRW
jgi:hypothetical protein